MGCCLVVTIKKPKGRSALTAEDYLRALSYVGLFVWALLYLKFPPNSTLEALDTTLRIIWMSVTMTGAAVAFFGVFRRIDIKMELPGLAFALLGPLFYFLTQVIFVLFPTPSSGDPSTRIALMAYALLPVLFALPRIVSLLIEARRLKKINTESVETARAIMKTISTGPVTTGGDKK